MTECERSKEGQDHGTSQGESGDPREDEMARGKRPDSNQPSQYSHREQPSAHVLWDVPGTPLSDFGTPSARPRTSREMPQSFC